MRISRLIAVVAASLALLTMPAQALTLQQAQAEVAGYSCGGSSCTSVSTGTRTEATPGAPIVSGGYSDTKSQHTDPQCFGPGFVHPSFPDTCVAVSLSDPASTSPTVVGYGPAGSKTIGTQTTTTKELVYNGPNTSRDTAWDVNTTVVTVDVP